MIHFLIMLIVLFVLILGLYTSVMIGHWLGEKQVAKHPAHKLEVVTVAETSVFALLGLLIAFTFSGAYDRYETRKMQIIVQANAFDTAYNYLDVLPKKYQADMQNLINSYMEVYLTAYNHLPFMNIVEHYLDQGLVIEQKIWNMAVKSANEMNNSSVAQSVLESLSVMFDSVHTGMDLTRVHPPAIIFVLMLMLSALGALLIGFVAAESNQKRNLHTICYVLLTAIIINVIFNLEFPRTGFIRSNSFDNILVDVKDRNNRSFSSDFSILQ